MRMAETVHQIPKGSCPDTIRSFTDGSEAAFGCTAAGTHAKPCGLRRNRRRAAHVHWCRTSCQPIRQKGQYNSSTLDGHRQCWARRNLALVPARTMIEWPEAQRTLVAHGGLPGSCHCFTG